MQIFRIADDRVIVEVADPRQTFDVHVLHTDEGIIVDVYDEGLNLADTIALCYNDGWDNTLEEIDND